MLIKPHYRVFGAFFLFAFSLGALLGRLPDVQENLELDKAQLGLMLSEAVERSAKRKRTFVLVACVVLVLGAVLAVLSALIPGGAAP